MQLAGKKHRRVTPNFTARSRPPFTIQIGRRDYPVPAPWLASVAAWQRHR
jgi:hypothetical protein